MDMKKWAGRILTMSFSILVLLGLCGCSQRLGKEEEPLVVGLVYYEKSDTFLNSLVEEIKKRMDEYEEEKGVTIHLMTRSSDSSQKLQNTQISELLDAGCDVLCVNLVDRADPSNIIDMARDKNVPIIFFNREPVEEDMKQWDRLYYVGADPAQSGKMQGELVLSYLEDHKIDKNRDGMIQYVVLEGEMGHQDSIIRTESAVDTLLENGLSIEKLSYQIANWNRAQAQNRMEQLIGQYKNQIELVLANNDDMALGAIDAYRELNYTKESWPVFFGIDATRVGLEAVQNEELAGTIYNDKVGQAAAISELAVTLLLKEDLQEIPFDKPGTIYVPYQKITKDMLGEFLK